MEEEDQQTEVGAVPDRRESDAEKESRNRNGRRDRSKGRSLPALPDHVEQYGLCLLFHLALPLLPLGVELTVSGAVSEATATLAAGMYAISIGGSSRSRLQFGFAICMCIVFSVAFGLSLGNPASAGSVIVLGFGVKELSFIALGSIFFVHSLERYNRHWAGRAPYWEF